MKKSIIWKGLNSLQTIEYCELLLEKDQTIVSAVIEGTVDGREVDFSYRIHVDTNWRTLEVSVQNRMGRDFKQLVYTSDGAGNWFDAEGLELSNFKGCIEIDIMLSPFTNSLPVKRLGMKLGESQHISVLYFDLLKFEVRRVEQVYTRLAEHRYKYENTENDFKALIEFDGFDLVSSYPGLFEMA
ncbi:hypothetical protein DBR43_01170 [Pedobacter sp. KBW06]|uniref:putative glycolipid-binding domain-containing protein n=1 Tax=Pedobacter sp. KBW06 TaxID=2153359 RepID=UPI000F5A0DD4|nr:putative glycolipid-binding domain-containing protein [Pedobacter sp. KBW06]RQO74046.1 hypothetical protein DBR43_01170 [Pedobacter sp. KBW06]